VDVFNLASQIFTPFLSRLPFSPSVSRYLFKPLQTTLCCVCLWITDFQKKQSKISNTHVRGKSWKCKRFKKVHHAPFIIITHWHKHTHKHTHTHTHTRTHTHTHTHTRTRSHALSLSRSLVCALSRACFFIYLPTPSFHHSPCLKKTENLPRAPLLYILRRGDPRSKSDSQERNDNLESLQINCHNDLSGLFCKW